jgi:hypothetical protein
MTIRTRIASFLRDLAASVEAGPHPLYQPEDEKGTEDEQDEQDAPAGSEWPPYAEFEGKNLRSECYRLARRATANANELSNQELAEVEFALERLKLHTYEALPSEFDQLDGDIRYICAKEGEKLIPHDDRKLYGHGLPTSTLIVKPSQCVQMDNLLLYAKGSNVGVTWQDRHILYHMGDLFRREGTKADEICHAGPWVGRIHKRANELRAEERREKLLEKIKEHQVQILNHVPLEDLEPTIPAGQELIEVLDSHGQRESHLNSQ